MYIKTLEIAGFYPAIKGMRNPLNSWQLSDSYTENNKFVLGDKDKNLTLRLINSGKEHRKFLRQIKVWIDTDMPRYWWSEADTYHFGTKNSCSTMHKLLNKQNPITKDQFLYCIEDLDIVEIVIQRLNEIRDLWQKQTLQKDKDYCLLRAKRLLLEGFLQLRTWDTNYEEIANMYHQRKNHRLKEEWQEIFCEWVQTLPYASELIIGGK